MDQFCLVEAQIRQLHARYVDAVWRKDMDAFVRCFMPDAEWRVAGQIFAGHDQIRAFMQSVFDRFTQIVMTFRTPILDVGEGWANGRTYVTEQNKLIAPGQTLAPMGVYYERFVETVDGWKFQWRLFHTTYFGPLDLSGQFFDGPDYGPPPAMPPLDAEAKPRT